MRLEIITAQLQRLPLWPCLEDIGAAMKAVPNPCGQTFESFIPHLDDEEREAETRH